MLIVFNTIHPWFMIVTFWIGDRLNANEEIYLLCIIFSKDQSAVNWPIELP